MLSSGQHGGALAPRLQQRRAHIEQRGPLARPGFADAGSPGLRPARQH
jgi:hypothetical protein